MNQERPKLKEKWTKIGVLWRAKENDAGVDLSGRIDIAMSSVILRDGDKLVVQLTGDERGPDANLFVTKPIQPKEESNGQADSGGYKPTDRDRARWKR